MPALTGAFGTWALPSPLAIVARRLLYPHPLRPVVLNQMCVLTSLHLSIFYTRYHLPKYRIPPRAECRLV